jgi:hypothetical protein
LLRGREDAVTGQVLGIVTMLQCNIALRGSNWLKKQAKNQHFSSISADFCLESLHFRLAAKPELMHIVAARYCDFGREAAALPGRFLPELGRSYERPFFCAGLLRPYAVAMDGFVAPSLVGLTPTSLDAPAQATKSLAQNRVYEWKEAIRLLRGGPFARQVEPPASW